MMQQDDLNKLIEWSEKWQMLFNFRKCKCLHTGHGNEDAQYTMGGTVLNTTLKEEDLGLTISTDMKVSACIGPALARYQPVSTLFRKMSKGKFFVAPPRECNFTAKLRCLSSTRRRQFCERFEVGFVQVSCKD